MERERERDEERESVSLAFFPLKLKVDDGLRYVQAICCEKKEMKTF